MRTLGKMLMVLTLGLGFGLTLVLVLALLVKSRSRFAKLDRQQARAIQRQEKLLLRTKRQAEGLEALGRELEALRQDLGKEIRTEGGSIRDKVQRQRDFLKGRLNRLERGEAEAELALLRSLMLTQTNRGVSAQPTRSPRIVVSLTTIPGRILEIAPTVESLLQQTLKPDEIVLWLDRQYLSDASIPLELRNQMGRGLRVEFCEDVGPHTKLIPALKTFPEDIIVTVDDDVLYPFYLVEVLYHAHLKDPEKVLCTRARTMKFSDDRGFVYLSDWKVVRGEKEGLDVFPLGVGGVLYPPHVFDNEVFDIDELRRLSPHADDIWFKTHTLRRNVVCKRLGVRDAEFALRPHSQDSRLIDINLHGGQNEVQTRACFDRYEVWNVLPASVFGRAEE